ncbi:transcriptional Regulator, XRE family protein [Microseira wollei NIES-4236]|uniref:Transcriptional Regulator, XRE family protein n=1 Tax=Microseira wollei NIES-4236 TaxID=2530354 RepID=A0AAV3XB55_9CYAN|nr:transcriptional Regulator, XRE family protein [Microseira wollei NIES-4236]
MGLIRLRVRELAALEAWTLKQVSERSGVGDTKCHIKANSELGNCAA